MPENNESTAVEQVDPQNPPSGFEPITSQEDLDKIVQKRLARERSKYADYDELAAKAAQFDESVEASKSELEKAIDRATAAEEALAASALEAERFKVIAELDLPADLHELVTGGDATEMRAKAEKLAAYVKPAAPRHRVVPTDGKYPARKPRSTANIFADTFAGRI